MSNKKLFLKRMYAGIIDMIIVLVPFLYVYYMHLSTWKGKISYSDFTFEYGILLILALLSYYYVCEAFSGSIGKKVCGIKIIYGRKRLLSKFLRPIFKVILFNFPILILISFFSKDYKIFYDMILGDCISEKKYERKDLRQ